MDDRQAATLQWHGDLLHVCGCLDVVPLSFSVPLMMAFFVVPVYTNMLTTDSLSFVFMPCFCFAYLIFWGMYMFVMYRIRVYCMVSSV